MSSISRKEFERLYSAELLPFSVADDAVGDIWDWKGFIFNRHLVPESQNIASVCNNPDLLSALTALPLLDASLPDIDITDDFKLDSSLTIPTTKTSLSEVITSNSIVSMAFTGVKAKDGKSLHPAMASALNDLKNSNFSLYDQKIRGYQIVMTLFYAGSVSLSVNKTSASQSQLQASLGSIQGASLTVDTSDANVNKYSIANSTCPFAAQFLAGRDI